jgi:hypothetical protein
MALRDIVSPRLRVESHLLNGRPAFQRVFHHDLHDVYLARYPSGMVTALVHYKRENLRIMIALETETVTTSGNPSPHGAWAEDTVGRLQGRGKTPHHLILQAKMETGTILGLHDRAALKMAGVEVPREAGRFKDLFGDSSS